MAHDVHPESAGDSDRQERISPAISPARARALRLPIVVAGVGAFVLIAALVVALIPRVTSPSGRTAGTETATPVLRVLYQASWADGAAGWTLPAHWHLVDGRIENDGYGTQPLLIPYRVTTQDYSVAVDFTVKSVPDTQVCHSYGIKGMSSSGALQFLGGIECIRHLAVAYHGFSENFVEHSDSAGDDLSTQDYTVSYSTQTFTTQVRDNNVGFCPGVACLSNLISTTPLWPIQIAIYDIGVQLSVTRVVLTSP